MRQYIIVNRDDILHYGKGHDDNPPGRGSGRYAWGSGKEGGEKKKVPKRSLFNEHGIRVTGRKYMMYNGELTDYGRKKAEKIQNSARKSAKEQKRAIKIIEQFRKKEKKRRDKLTDQNNRARELIDAGKRTYTEKDRQREIEYVTSLIRDTLQKQKLEDIRSGKMKAGRDYISERSTSIFAIPVGPYMYAKMHTDKTVHLLKDGKDDDNHRYMLVR